MARRWVLTGPAEESGRAALSIHSQLSTLNQKLSTQMKLHNAMWPGLVGKEPGTAHPPIALDHMLELTAATEVDGRKVDGVDLFLFAPHTDPDISEDDLTKMADMIAAHGLAVGSLVAPIWPGTVGASAMGSAEDQGKF